MIGGLGDLFSAVVNISRARDVSAMSGDQLKLKAMIRRGRVKLTLEAMGFGGQLAIACPKIRMSIHEQLESGPSRLLSMP